MSSVARGFSIRVFAVGKASSFISEHIVLEFIHFTSRHSKMTIPFTRTENGLGHANDVERTHFSMRRWKKDGKKENKSKWNRIFPFQSFNRSIPYFYTSDLIPLLSIFLSFMYYALDGLRLFESVFDTQHSLSHPRNGLRKHFIISYIIYGNVEFVSWWVIFRSHSIPSISLHMLRLHVSSHSTHTHRHPHTHIE